MYRFLNILLTKHIKLSIILLKQMNIKGEKTMKNTVIRLKQIRIQNFKNVVDGEITLIDEKKDYLASILGLYGQNGSGKTALIDALSLLKASLCGTIILPTFAECINVNASFARFSFAFLLEDIASKMKYNINYNFKIKKEADKAKQNIDNPGDNSFKTILFDELLTYSFKAESGRKTTQTIMNTASEGLFISKKRMTELFGDTKTVETDLLVAKRVTEESSRSCIFSYEVMKMARDKHNNGSNIRPVFGDDKNLLYYFLESLVDYGHNFLYVIPTINSALNSFNMLSLSFRYTKGQEMASGIIPVYLNQPTLISAGFYPILCDVVKDMNIVLEALVPGLRIEVVNLGEQLLIDGSKGILMQFTSLKNEKKIPLQFESEGIKKIIAVLHLLIAVYNDPSITVAIDELDAGVFEYLLGELLRILEENGKGQLIFTSHNLRPLETLDKKFVAFTTTNPFNRYIRLKNVKTNNNLRDFYYRDIVLGGQDDPVYNFTNNYEIALAFKEAGDISDS